MHTIRLREPWERQAEPEGGRLLARWFNAPTGIGAREKVFLVVEGVAAPAVVLLNDQEIGRTLHEGECGRWEITGLLRLRNRICLRIEAITVVESRALDDDGGLAPVVRLEIEAGAGAL